MNKHLRILISIVLILKTASLRLFLIGGGSNQNSTQVFGALAKTISSRQPMPKNCDDNWDTTKCPRIAVITSAAGSQADGNDAFSNDSDSMSYRTMYKNYGLTPKHITAHIDNYKIDTDPSTARGRDNLQIINQADIFYFNGGDQSRHIRTWLNDDGTPNQLLAVIKKRAFNDEVVLSGTSAGSMIWGNMTFGSGCSFGAWYFHNSVGLAPKKITDGAVNGSGLADIRNGTKSLQYEDNLGKMPAFGFINFTVDTHFNARGRLGRIVPVLMDLKEGFGMGVDENTSLFYQNGLGTVYGWNGVTFSDITNAIPVSLTYFSIRNVTVHYLTQGDKFDFRSRKVISNKTIINTPAYTNPTDSNDILSAYQASLLQTRVVDQKSLYNLGRTKTPSGYPKGTPIFQVKFYRNANTKGYYGNKKYTAESVVIDYSYSTNNLVLEE